MQTLIRRGVGDAAAGLGLPFLHMSEGPFSHDAGHMGFNPYPAKEISAKCFVCYNFQGASMSLKVGETIVRVSNNLDVDETLSNS